MTTNFDLIRVFDLPVFKDHRGYLLKAVLNEFVGESNFGEIYFVQSEPGIIRANHYHKIATEWFVVVAGSATLLLVDIKEPNSRVKYELSSENHKCVMIPPGIAHSLIAQGNQPMLMMALSDKPYNPLDTDTYTYSFE